MEENLLHNIEPILVLSGKGGVGKSTVSVQLASALNSFGYKVGILDIDFCGPSIPRMIGVESEDVLSSPSGKWIPVAAKNRSSLYVMSLAFFLESKNDAVIWRGPKKNAMIKQMLTNVAWDVDFLIIDTPPGTSDEHISVMENLSKTKIKGAVLVTTPQMVAVDDVTRELTFCRKTRIPVLGIVENMSGFVCPNCSECSNLLATGGGEQLAMKANVPFLGRIPIDPSLALSLEEGRDFLQEFSSSKVSLSYGKIVEALIGSKMEVE